MISPLAVDKETVEKFSIPKEIELHPRQKKAFLEAQLHELKSAQWRARVDIMHAKRLQESDNLVLKNKGLQNESEHTNQVQQFTGGIVMIQQLIEELDKENPDMGATTPKDDLEA